jgi:hypothetical protein
MTSSMRQGFPGAEAGAEGGPTARSDASGSGQTAGQSGDGSAWTAVLTRSELYLLAMVARAGHLLGLEDPFLGCLAEEVDDLLSFARRTLIARGQLLVSADEGVALPPAMADLVRTNSQARRTLVLSAGGQAGAGGQTRDGGQAAEQVRLIHVMPRQCLEQQALADGRIALRAVPGANVAGDRVRAFLRIPPVPAAPGPPITVRAADLAEARHLALSQDQAGSAVALARAQVPAESVPSLADALGSAGTSGSLTTLLREARAIRYGESAAWIVGGQGAWLVQALDRRRGAVRLLPASSEGIWRRVETIAGGAR